MSSTRLGLQRTDQKLHVIADPFCFPRTSSRNSRNKAAHQADFLCQRLIPPRAKKRRDRDKTPVSDKSAVGSAHPSVNDHIWEIPEFLRSVKAHDDDDDADELDGPLLGVVDRVVDGPVAVDGDGAEVENGRRAQKDVGRCEELTHCDPQEPPAICKYRYSSLFLPSLYFYSCPSSGC